MIRSVSANRSSFRSVVFKPGLNIVLADRTKEATRKDSRNGLGKSTLIDIIHFGLGSDPRKGEGLLVVPLQDWIFTLELEIGGSVVAVSRNTSSPKNVMLAGSFDHWPIKPEYAADEGAYTLSIKDWSAVLGYFMFDVPVNGYPISYSPKFRGLISYFSRRGPDAYSIPFEHYRKQLEWDKQVSNAFLLDLAWEDASEWQLLRDKKNHIENLRKAMKAGVFSDMFGSLGELEAEKIRLDSVIKHNQEGLRTFNVHPQYNEINSEAHDLTSILHALNNSKFQDEKRLEFLRASLAEEKDVEPKSVEAIYREAGVSLPGVVKRRLEDVQQFHTTVVINRRSFLEQEIEALQRAVIEKDQKIQDVSEKRGKLMSVLATHGPWEEYSNLQQRQSEAIARLESLTQQIERLKAFEAGKSTLRIENEMLLTKARRDYSERSAQREYAVQVFNGNSEFLYEAPGNLVIDITDSGYKFNIEIQRSGSGGVGHMKVFCYDLLLAELWSRKKKSPGFLIQDSIIFDGVDERQKANALILAENKSNEHKFQYICTMNSDSVPFGELGEFPFDSFVRLTLTDESVEGSLLGIRY